MNKLIAFLVCLFLTLSLSGCGFRLRGSANLPPQLHTLYLQSNAPYTQFMRQLRSNLRYSHVHLAESAANAPYTLAVLSENMNTQETSIGGSQQMRNYVATYSVNYVIRDSKGRRIYGPNSISEQQTITIVANEILTNSNKLIDARRIMSQNLISKIMFQLTSKDLVQTLQQKTAQQPHKKRIRQKRKMQHENKH